MKIDELDEMAADLKLCSISEPPNNDEQGETALKDHDDMDSTCPDDSQLAQQQDTTASLQKPKQRIRRTFTTYQWLTLMGGGSTKAIRDHQ